MSHVLVSDELDKSIRALQNQVVASVVGTPKIEGESIEDFIRRRCRIASGLTNGKRWDDLMHKRALKWHRHVLRMDPMAWPRAVLEFHGEEWLQAQRRPHIPLFSFALTPFTLTAGRTATRHGRGKPALRWEAYIRSRGNTG